MIELTSNDEIIELVILWFDECLSCQIEHHIYGPGIYNTQRPAHLERPRL